MNNIFTNKKIYEMLGKSKGPGKLTEEVKETFDKSGDGEPFQNKDFALLRKNSKPPESGGVPKTIKEKKGKKERLKSSEGETSAEAKKRRATNKQNRKDSRRQKTVEKIENAKNATKGKKSNNVEGNSQVVKKSNKAKRLEQRLKRQEGRAERKKIRKAGKGTVTENAMKDGKVDHTRQVDISKKKAIKNSRKKQNKKIDYKIKSEEKTKPQNPSRF